LPDLPPNTGAAHHGNAHLGLAHIDAELRCSVDLLAASSRALLADQSGAIQ